MNFIFANITPSEIYFCESHKHPCWEVVLQLRGSAVTEIQGQEFHLEPGSLIIIPPETSHLEKSDNLFLDMYIQAKDLPFKNKPFSVTDNNGTMAEMFRLIHKCYLDGAPKEVLNSQLEAICEYITYLSGEKYKYDFVRDFKSIMVSNISNPDFDFSEEISKMGFNYDYFRRCFKEDVGSTPLEYLTMLRISHGKKLLRQTPFYSVAEIAYQCGFTDPFYFSRCFKKHVGLSPMEYKTKD